MDMRWFKPWFQCESQYPEFWFSLIVIFSTAGLIVWAAKKYFWK